MEITIEISYQLEEFYFKIQEKVVEEVEEIEEVVQIGRRWGAGFVRKEMLEDDGNQEADGEDEEPGCDGGDEEGDGGDEEGHGDEEVQEVEQVVQIGRRRGAGSVRKEMLEDDGNQEADGEDEESDADEVTDLEQVIRSISAESWPTLQQVALELGLGDLEKQGVPVEVFSGADAELPADSIQLFQCSLDSYRQIRQFWELRFCTEFYQQGPRRGKSSSKSTQVSQDSVLLSNRFKVLQIPQEMKEE